MSQIERGAAAPARAWLRAASLAGLAVLTSGLPAASQAARADAVAGIVNFTPIDDRVTVGGALSVEALPELRRRGFRAVINLRQASEAGANVEAEGAAVRAAGLKYIHLPFSATDPYDVAAPQVDLFLKTFADRSNWPVFVHSAQSHRPTGLLVIKRVREDGWSVEQAYAAADAQVLSDGSAGSKGMRDFVAVYLKAHGR
jgi:protein tyrosine phosphatase (PTP) superfamily phosphohydrolase (DUF442 family)